MVDTKANFTVARYGSVPLRVVTARKRLILLWNMMDGGTKMFRIAKDSDKNDRNVS